MAVWDIFSQGQLKDKAEAESLPIQIKCGFVGSFNTANISALCQGVFLTAWKSKAIICTAPPTPQREMIGGKAARFSSMTLLGSINYRSGCDITSLPAHVAVLCSMLSTGGSAGPQLMIPHLSIAKPWTNINTHCCFNDSETLCIQVKRISRTHKNHTHTHMHAHDWPAQSTSSCEEVFTS